ncbi:Sterol 3-beta-glucosyltransferase [Phytophthora cactorum]|nr:Sterol 3-beta-glucosyltransferase [Phytophthora cactorum]
MHRTAPVDTLPSNARSFASDKFRKVHRAILALQRPDGHIQLEFPAEDAIDLQTPRVNTIEVQSGSPDSSRQEHDAASKTPKVNCDDYQLVSVPPLMSICILIVGTRGDVQPFLAIAQRLQRDGHRVRLATHAVYRDFVMSHGVEFYPLGGDPKELAAYMVKTGGHLIPTKIETLTKDVPRNREMINEIVLSTWPAVSDADPDGGGPGVPGPPFRAQAIIANPVSYGHIHVAERLGVPLHIMFPQPWVPTMAFPHPLSNLAYTGKWQKRNYLSYKLVDLIMWHGTEGLINEFRTEVLKLRPIRNGDLGSELLLDLNIPHAFMWSPKLVPKPADWGDLYDVIGTVTLKEAASVYSPSPELEAFLGDDGGPIFVGFGSMILANPLATTKMIIEAAKQANVRVLIQSSWSDMAGDIEIPSNVFFLGNCPHDWLMPRVSAVVHHGGAGTTAAGLLAGKPTFIVPFFGDQPFWGQAVVSARVGVAPCSITQLTTEILRKAFVDLANPELRERAEAMQHIMQQEDGAEEAVCSFYRHLPTQDMWCDLDHQRIASQWSVHDRIKLCDRCAFVVRERQGKKHQSLLRYNAVDYSARGPSSLLTGVATGVIVFAHELTGAFTGVLVQPAKGLIKGGIVGGIKGTVAGVYYLLVRPVHGALLLADHAATGQKNANREEGHRKLNSVFDRHLMAALGAEDGLVDTFCLAVGPNAVDLVIFVRRKDREKMLKQLRHAVKRRYRTRYEALLKAERVQQLRLQKDGVLFSVRVEPQSRYHQPAQEFPSNDITLLDAEATTSVVECINMDKGKASTITLKTAKLTPTGVVEISLNVPDESADVVEPSTTAEWEACSRVQKAQETDLSVPVMNICLATIENHVRIIFQTREVGDKKRDPYQSANVLQIPSDLNYTRLFQEQNVVAAIHWGEPDITAEALSAGKPVGMCGTHSLQHFMACVCEQAQVGLPLIDWETCTVESLALNFRDLLHSDTREKAKRLSTTFDRAKPVKDAVKAFYANLPVEAMSCDVDPAKIARVFDPRHKVKLSLQAYVAVQPRRDESKGFEPYRPLRYGGSHPPTFSIRDSLREERRDTKPVRQYDAVRLTLDMLEIPTDDQSYASSNTSTGSTPSSSRVTSAMFWSSAEEEAAVRKATIVAYDRLVKELKNTSKREAMMRFFGVGNEARRRQEELLYMSVE